MSDDDDFKVGPGRHLRSVFESKLIEHQLRIEMFADQKRPVVVSLSGEAEAVRGLDFQIKVDPFQFEYDYRYVTVQVAHQDEKEPLHYGYHACVINKDDKKCLKKISPALVKVPNHFGSLLKLAKWEKITAMRDKSEDTSSDEDIAPYRVQPRYKESFLQADGSLVVNVTIHGQFKKIDPPHIVAQTPPAATIYNTFPAFIKQDLSKIMWDDKLIPFDFTIECGRIEIRCHRFVLALRSPVLAQLFQGQSREVHEKRMAIRDVDPFVAQQFVKFIYTDELTAEYLPIVKSLLALAARYKVTGLKIACGRALSKMITLMNVMEIKDLSRIYILRDLEQDAIAYLAKHAVEGADYTGWAPMSVNTRPRVRHSELQCYQSFFDQ